MIKTPITTPSSTSSRKLKMSSKQPAESTMDIFCRFKTIHQTKATRSAKKETFNIYFDNNKKETKNGSTECSSDSSLN
jgi:hypothetical protein